MRKIFATSLAKFISICLVSVLLIALLGSVVVHALVVESQKNVNVIQEELDELKQEHRNLKTQEVSARSADVIVKAAEERGMIASPAIDYIPNLNTTDEN